jgi:hypothetical protein
MELIRDLIAKVIFWAVPFKADAAWRTLENRLTELEDDVDVFMGKVDGLTARLGEYVESQVRERN